MITAVDTNVLLDILGPDPQLGDASKRAVQRSLAQGQLVACDIVWAEVASFFLRSSDASNTLQALGIRFSLIDERAALAAGKSWKAYRRRGGHRTRVIPDFLIGAHAMVSAERLLTRDRGFYRTYFKRLKVLDPTVIK